MSAPAEAVETPRRVQLSRKKGWRMPENTVSVARPGPWGNPFSVELVGLDIALDMFRDLLRGFFDPYKVSFLTDLQFTGLYEAKNKFCHRHGAHPAEAVTALRGKNLACWCRLDAPCHADVLLELANQPRAQLDREGGS